VGTLVAALFLGLAAFLLLAQGLGGRTIPPLAGGGSSTSPSQSAGMPPTASPAPSPDVSPTPSPIPTATVDPFANARAASDDMRAAIAAARGPGGLNGRDAKDLGSQLDQVDQALNQQDTASARDAAIKLAGQVAGLIDQGTVDGQAADQLQTAADRLVAAANALPD